MNLSATIKTLIVAAVCYAGSLVVYYLGQSAKVYDYLPVSDEAEPWRVYDYVSLGLLMVALGCTIASVLLFRAEIEVRRKALPDLQ